MNRGYFQKQCRPKLQTILHAFWKRYQVHVDDVSTEGRFMRPRRVMAAGIAAITAATGLMAFATPAQAVANYGCSYPYVCFYLNSSDWAAASPTATYKDMGYWQTLGSRSRGSFMVYNSRNDDGALLRFTDGRTFCLNPSINAD